MIKQTPGKIFLADQREVLETAHYQRYSLRQPEVQPDFCGRLLALHDESLAGGGQVQVAAAEAAYVLLIPVTGAVQLHPAAGVPTLIHVEEMYLTTVPAGGALHLSNPYPSETISFLHLWLAAPAAAEALTNRVFDFDMTTLGPQLVEVTQVVPKPVDDSAVLPFRVSLGRFAGRQEALYSLHTPTAQFFAFVLAGAFEVEGRLLHPKDGLCLRDTPQVELEALSNEAFVIVVELAA